MSEEEKARAKSREPRAESRGEEEKRRGGDGATGRKGEKEKVRRWDEEMG